MLSRKVKPSDIINGVARVGKLGSEYLNTSKLIPEEIAELVTDRIQMSTKK